MKKGDLVRVKPTTPNYPHPIGIVVNVSHNSHRVHVAIFGKYWPDREIFNINNLEVME